MSDIVIITRFPAAFNGLFWAGVLPAAGFTRRTGCTVVLSCDVLGGKPKTRVENCTQEVHDVLTGFRSSKLSAENPQSDFQPFSNIYGLSSARPLNFAFFSASVAPGTAILLSASAVVN